MNSRFFCKECNRYFDDPKYYYETHGLVSPPYERVAVCPECEGDDFVEFECFIDKIQVAQTLLPIIMKLNTYISGLEKVFGNKIENKVIDEVVLMLCDAITEMFEFLDVDMQRKIMNVDNENDLLKILCYLDGEL